MGVQLTHNVAGIDVTCDVNAYMKLRVFLLLWQSLCHVLHEYRCTAPIGILLSLSVVHVLRS